MHQKINALNSTVALWVHGCNNGHALENQTLPSACHGVRLPMKNRRRLNARFLQLEALEERQLLAAPVLDPISAVSVPAHKSLLVPLTASDADGNPLTYSVTSSSGTVSGRILTAGPDLKISVAGYGDMVFQLFPEFAPNTVSTMVGLANKGYFDGLTFHRVISNFMIQGGDPKGDGTGGPGFQFDDEFNPEAIFSGTGQLAMANSGKDTNGSQFFVTVGNQRFLDGNHAIWGQLLRGFDVLQKINSVATNGSSAPLTPVKITSISVVQDTADAVLLLDAGAVGSSTVTVTVNDGAGGQASKSFTAASVTDTTNDPPILGSIGNQVTTTSTPISFPLSSTDLEGDPVTYGVAVLDNPAHATASVSGNIITVTPTVGYTGVVNLIVGVFQTGASSRGSTSNPWDTQKITLTVKDQVLTPTAIPLAAISGETGSGAIASFTAAVPYAASSFTASIDWGDGSPLTAGTISAQPNGSYLVSGAHTFTAAQTFTIHATLTDTLSKATSSVDVLATVTAPPPTSKGTFLGLTQTPGTGVFYGTLASFTGVDAAVPLTNLTATIAWGDATTTPGTLVREADGSLSVSGMHLYAALGAQSVVITLANQGATVTTASGTLTVANRPPTLDAIGPQTVVAGTTLKLTAVAHEPDAGQTVSYALAAGAPAGASINSATGVISWLPAQGPSTASFTVVATDSGSPALSASQTFLVNVTEAPVAPTVALGSALSVRQFDTLTAAGKFSDPGAGPWTATVDYGDGTGAKPLALTAAKTFALSHTYLAGGTYTVLVRVASAGGLVGTSTLGVTVAPAPLVRLTATARVLKKAVVGFTLTATGPIDPTTVTSLLNYSLVAAGKDKKFGTKDDVKTAFKTVTYDASRNVITLNTAKGVVPTGVMQFQVTGLKDSHGRAVPTFLASLSKTGVLTVLKS